MGTRDSAHVLQFDAAIRAIQPPLMPEEVAALLAVFPENDLDYYGLAWSVVHLVETHKDLDKLLDKTMESGEWIQELKSRIRR